MNWHYDLPRLNDLDWILIYHINFIELQQYFRSRRIPIKRILRSIFLSTQGPPSKDSNLVYQIPTRIEGQDVQDSRKGLFCSLPPSWLIVSNQGGVQFLYNTPSLRFFAHEARQRWKLWKKACVIVTEAWNDEDNIMQDWTYLSLWEIKSFFFDVHAK